MAGRKSETFVEQLDDGWVRKTYIGPQSISTRISYLYKGKHLSITIQMQTKRARSLAGYQLIEKDLRDALIWLSELERLNKPTDERKFINNPQTAQLICKGLFKAAIINCMKAYDNGNGRFVALDKSSLPEDLRAAYKNFDELRNQYVAHGGASEFEECKILFALPPKEKIKPNDRFNPRFDSCIRQAIFTDWNKDEFKRLIETSKEIVSKKIEKAKKSVIEEFLKLNLDMIAKHAKGTNYVIVTEANLSSFT